MSGETISISLLRVPAGSEEQRVGSLVVNPGGPGGSGIQYAANASSYFGSELRQAYDIIGFDPRGFGGELGLRGLEFFAHGLRLRTVLFGFGACIFQRGGFLFGIPLSGTRTRPNLPSSIPRTASAPPAGCQVVLVGCSFSAATLRHEPPDTFGEHRPIHGRQRVMVIADTRYADGVISEQVDQPPHGADHRAATAENRPAPSA